MKSAEESDRNAGFAAGAQLGAYVLAEPLGAGGMGRVFAATHSLTGERVAVKTLITRGPVTLEYFRREIETLQGLRHPAIVPLRDQGVLDGQPWYAMTLLEGVTLRDALEQVHAGASPSRDRESWVPTSGVGERAAASAERSISHHGDSLDSERFTPEALLRACSGVLGALDYLHARGVVHGDIKPENIFLRADGRPVLVDFGLASSFDCAREQLSLIPRSIGSVAYMAPEQLRGRLADARADLYAVGCILYEALTGTHPFLRGTIEATALAHLQAERIPPSRLRPEIPRQLDMLVLRLVAKAPEDRPGYAGDALQVISSSAFAPVAEEAASESDASPRSGYLYRGPLVGRDGLLGRLRARLKAAHSGRAAKLRLRGERGLGKTRIALELVEMALRDECAVFHVACPSPAESHEHPHLAPLRALLRILDDHQEDTLLDEQRARLEAIRSVLDRASAPAAGAKEQAGGVAATLIQNLCDEILARCRDRTVLLLIDDAHYADALTREFVGRLAASETTDHRLMLLCTDGTAGSGDPSETFRHFEDVGLTGLDEASTALAIRSLLAVEHPSPALVTNAYQVSQGNPFVIRQYLRALIDGGVLRRDRHRGWHLHGSVDGGAGQSKPLRIESVTTLFEWRLRDLTAQELELAVVAAVLDTSFDEGTLAAVARRAPSEVEPLLLALSRKEVLKPEGRRGYGFTHPILAEILRARARAPHRTRIHRRAAAVLKHRHAELAPAPNALAVHLRECGSHHKASRWFRTAATQYLEAHRRDEALAALEAAAEELSRLRSFAAHHTQELFALKETTGDVAMQLRRYPKAQQAYGEALQLVESDLLRTARVHRKLAGAHQRDRAVAMDCLQKAIGALTSVNDPSPEYYAEWIQVHLDAMWVHYWRQETSKLLELAESIGPLVHHRGTLRQRASLHFNLAVGLMQRYRYVTGATELSHVDEALHIYEALDDRANVAMCRFVRAMIQLFGGDLPAAEHGFEAVLALSERATSVTIRVRALTFLCILHRKRRDLERVRKLAAAAHSLATEHDMLEYRGTAMANLAWVACFDGEFAECERLVQSALAAWNASPLNVFRWTGLLPLMAVIQFRPERSSDAAELSALARDMLHPSQQALPPELTDELTKLSSSGDAPAAVVRRLAKRVLDLAADANLM